MVVSNNVNKTNQVNDVVDNGLKFDSINSLANNPIKYTLLIVTIRLRGDKKYRQNISKGLTCLWESGSTDRMINFKHINPSMYKLRANQVEYSMAAGPYKTTHGVKVPFRMLDFSSRNFNTLLPF